MTSLLLVALLLQPAPPAPQDEAAQMAEAKAHFERGKELFRSGAYDQAIQEFKQADQIRPSPILAYNIGLAYEKLNRCKAAVGFFQRYLREQPDADNRADTESKIAEQQGKLSRGECAGQRVTPPGPGPGPGTGFVEPPPPPGGGRDVTPPPLGPKPGTHGTALGLRFGPIFGGLGNEITKDVMDSSGMNLGPFENGTGFHLQPTVQFPMVMLTDGRVVLQGEVFGSIALYGFSDKIAIQGSQVSGSARFLAAGFAARGNIFVSDRVPIAFAPALGFGAGVQLFEFRTANGACDFSSGIPTAFVVVDAAMKYELFEHHAFYFSPANVHIFLPGLSDGGTLDPCAGGTMAAPAEKVFGTDGARVNYGIDLGYLFQF